MKLLTHLHVAIALCTLTFTHAKQLKRVITEPKTFIELVNFVKTGPLIWDTTTSMLSEQSIDILKKGAQTASLDNAQFNVILDMTSTRIPFTGNAEQDKKYAINYVAQKEDIVKDYPALINQDIRSLQEKQTEMMETPAVDHNAITQFITELIQKNAENLKGLHIPALRTIIAKIKTTYESSDELKAVKPILLAELRKVAPDVTEERWNEIVTYIERSLPSE